MEGCTELVLQPGLETEIAIPDQPFEERIDERHDQQRRAQLRTEARTLGDAAGDDCRDRRSKGQQEEELHQGIAVVGHQLIGRLHERHAIGDPVADEEVRQGRYGEVGDDLRQGIDLVLQAHGPDFEKGEAGMHGQHHHRAHQEEQGIGAMDQGFHGAVEVFHGLLQPQREYAPKR